MPTLAEFQGATKEALDAKFGGTVVCSEWRSLQGEIGLYSPRVDVAVGPFATERRQLAAVYDALIAEHQPFFETLHQYSLANVRNFDGAEQVASYHETVSFNNNARCLLAIEIENAVTRKHLMGGAVNAAALSRVGLVVGWTPEKVRALVKLRRYLRFLAEVGKSTFNTTNLLILTPEQLSRALAAR